MRRILVLTLALLFAPALVAAQVEVGLDLGLSVTSTDGASDNTFDVSVPTPTARIGFMAGESLIVDSKITFGYSKTGDASGTGLALIPGIDFLVNEQLYVRGEAGLLYSKTDDGVNPSDSDTQYLFGAAVGIRQMQGEGAVVRLEAFVDKLLENTDDLLPSSWVFGVAAGVSGIL